MKILCEEGNSLDKKNQIIFVGLKFIEIYLDQRGGVPPGSLRVTRDIHLATFYSKMFLEGGWRSFTSRKVVFCHILMVPG